MMVVKRGASFAGLLMLAGLLAGCATVGDSSAASVDQPQQLTAPETDSAVDSNALPPIGGADGSVQVANADAGDAANAPAATSGTPVVPGTADAGLTTGATAAPAGTGAQSAFVSLNDVGKVSSTPGRDLTGSLTVEKLLGGWTVTSGSDQCRLNLTYTATDASSTRYRASAPACAMPALASVASWQLSGTQVQLFNDAGALVGALLLSGNRFLGTLSGGQQVTMVG